MKNGALLSAAGMVEVLVQDLSCFLGEKHTVGNVGTLAFDIPEVLSSILLKVEGDQF